MPFPPGMKFLCIPRLITGIAVQTCCLQLQYHYWNSTLKLLLVVTTSCHPFLHISPLKEIYYSAIPGIRIRRYSAIHLYLNLGGGFKYIFCSPLFGEDEPNLTNIFQKGLVQPPTIYLLDPHQPRMLNAMNPPFFSLRLLQCPRPTTCSAGNGQRPGASKLRFFFLRRSNETPWKIGCVSVRGNYCWCPVLGWLSDLFSKAKLRDLQFLGIKRSRLESPGVFVHRI